MSKARAGIGQTIGHFKVMRPYHPDWVTVECGCGKAMRITRHRLLRGSITHCGCIDEDQYDSSETFSTCVPIDLDSVPGRVLISDRDAQSLRLENNYGAY